MFNKSLLAVALTSVLLPSTYSIADDSVVHQGIDENIEVSDDKKEFFGLLLKEFAKIIIITRVTGDTVNADDNSLRLLLGRQPLIVAKAIAIKGHVIFFVQLWFYLSHRFAVDGSSA